MRFLVVVFALAFQAQAKVVPSFEDYIVRFKKTYTTEEYDVRKKNFQASLVEIDRLNAHAEREGTNTVYKPTHFSDMSKEEFKSKMLGFRPREKRDTSHIRVRTSPQVNAPNQFDWRDHGAVTPVKNQGQCGSCWAFSVTEEIESTMFLAGHKLTELSPQAIVSCDKVDAGCNGGDPPSAYKWVEKNGGLPGRLEYPYVSGTTGVTGRCHNVELKPASNSTISGFVYATKSCERDPRCRHQNETALRDNLLKHGPVSICVNAEKWQNYGSGVMTASACGGHGYRELDHCVQLVGYDMSAPTAKHHYWKVRNSWGVTWGVKGYIHLEFGTNTCGVADEATQTEMKG